jgi:aldose 1-epimerase
MTGTKNLALGVAVTACLVAVDARADSIGRQDYGQPLKGGQQVEQYTLTNAQGMSVRFITLGGCITAIDVPDRNGRLDNVVLAFRGLPGYMLGDTYFGAIVGRYANRIAKGTFTLNGQAYHLPLNNGPNSLHGGTIGFHTQLWNVAVKPVPNGAAAVLSYTSPDGQDGYPGTLKVQVTYTLQDDNALRIDYEATTDKPTVLNLTNHSYFNLDGNGTGTALDQVVQINADSYTPADATLIPTGEIASVAGTPMDFRTPRPLGARIRAPFPQLVLAHGYDHNWVLNKQDGNALSVAATAYSPLTGRIMEVDTTEPGVQLYTGNFLNGSIIGSAGGTYRQGDGYTFETQHFPDSPNHPNFPSTVLNPGQEFHSTTIFRFATDS